MSNKKFIRQGGTYQYRNTGNFLSLECYWGGFGVLVSNSDVGARLKYFCGREERTVSKAKAGSEGPEEQVRHVVWRVSWSKDWDNFDLPGTGRNIKDILRDFFLAYESGKPTEVVFGH